MKSVAKPTRLKVLAGNPGKRPLNECEPEPSSAGLACPAWLGEEARAVWRRTVPEMKRLGVFTNADESVIASFCHIYGRFITEVKAGEQPAVTTLTHLRQYAAELGLTPSSRSKIVVPKKGHDTKAQKYFAA